MVSASGARPGTRATGRGSGSQGGRKGRGWLWAHLCPGQQSSLSVPGLSTGESPRAEPHCLQASGTWDTSGKWGEGQDVPPLPLPLPLTLVAMVPPGDWLLQPSFPPLPEQRGAGTWTL